MPNEALTINEQTLKALQIAGQILPVSSVATAANVALEILQIAQSVKNSKEDFIAIGRDSCAIVEIVVYRAQVGQNLQLLKDPLFLRPDGDMLLADMWFIRGCVKRAKKRSIMWRIFNHQSDQDTIQECRERLTHAMGLFGLRLDIDIHLQLASLCNQLTTAATLLRQLSLPPLHSQPEQSQPRWQVPFPFPATPFPQTTRPLSSTNQYHHPSIVSIPPPVVASPTLRGSQESAECTARHQARPDEISQQQTNMADQNQVNVMLSSPAGRSVLPSSNIQDHLFSAGINSSCTVGNVTNVSRDGSFNVAGSGHNISVSFAR